MRIAAITGLAAEARIARRAGIPAIATGGHPHRIAQAAEQLVREGAEGLLSFGIAGALAPELKPGDLLLPRRVVDESGTVIEVNGEWHARVLDCLATAGLRVQQSDLLGASGIVASAAEKAAAHRRTGAIAVDLETHHITWHAAQFRQPFLALRAIADPASLDLPPAAILPLDEMGRPRLGLLFCSVLRRPAQALKLLHLARDTRNSLRALSSAVELCSQ